MKLTPRETEVLRFVAEGRLSKQIAGDLGISVRTVGRHRDQLMQKLGIRGVVGLTHYAIRAGIIVL